MIFLSDFEVMSALRLSEETYRILYEDNPTMYFAVDQAGMVLSVNRFGAAELGYEVEDLLGQPVTEVFHPDDREAVKLQLTSCCEKPGHVFDWKLRKVRRDGSVLWVRERARAVREAEDNTIVLIVCEDITERQRTQRELQESRERYRTLYTSTPAMLHSVDREYRLIDVSEHWLEVLGYERDEVIGRPLCDFLTEDTKEFARNTARLLFEAQGFISNLEYQFVKKNGGTVDVLVSAISEVDDDGKFLRSLAVLVDITERKKTETELQKAHDQMEQKVAERTAELERQQAFLRQVMDVDPNFIFAKDRDGRFTLVNQAVAEVYGTTVEELIGKTDADFNPNPDEVEFFRRMDLEVMDTLKERFIPEEVVTDSEGRVRWLQTVKRPLFAEDGTADQVLGSATDITARKQAEQLLQTSEAALLRSQKRLRELAGRLLNAQEEERRRLAREIHDDISQRLAGLAILTGRLEESFLRAGGSESAEQVAEINRELVRLSGDVHAISRELHPSMLEHLGLEDAIRSECEIFSDRAGIAVNFASESVPQDVSKEVGICLYRIAQEALHNVAKHAKAHEARVLLQRTDGWLELTIEDQGIGFDGAAPPETFRGVGLASMEERARFIQAELEIDAVPGRGTKVLVRAPVFEGALSPVDVRPDSSD